MREIRIWSVAMLAIASSCGGGAGEGGSVAGLSTPEQVTIVEADGNSASSLRLPSGLAAAGLTDYESDGTRIYVHDDSMSALQTINSILNALDQTNYDDASVVNAGPYLALVQFEEGGGGDSRDSTPQYEEWVIDSARASNSAPHILKFWIKSTEGGDSSPTNIIIYGKATIRESPSDTNPVGDFTLYFKSIGAALAHDDSDTLFEGHLTTVARDDGQSEYAFFMSHGDVDAPPSNNQTKRERCRVVGNPQAETGRAFTERKETGNFGGGPQVQGEQFDVQFNATHLVRKRIASTTGFKAFDRRAFTTYVHRYGLYDADGARVSRLSGFPVDTTDGKHGWVGFHGMWFPPDVTIADGQQLVRRSFQPGLPTLTYSAVVVPGRLEKHTKRSITLADIVDEDFETFDQVAREQLRVKWTGSDLVKTGRRNGNTWDPIDPPVSIASSYSNGQFVHMFSQHRGGVEFSWPSGGLANTTVAYARIVDVITASSPELASGNLALLGYVRRLKAGITQPEANYSSGQVPYFADATTVAEPKNYLFDKDTLLLKLAGTTVGLAPGVTVTQGPGVHGFECGPMVTSALTSLSELHQQSTTFVWSTGPNQWNQLRTVKDANNDIVNFDPPLVFEYTHNEIGSAFNGRRFMLEWDGNHLGGIPFREAPGGRFYAEFNIPSGSTVSANGVTYRLKQLEGQQLMNEISDVMGVITAQGFDLTANLLTPPTAEYVDPAIGALPDLTGVAPRFVGGVAQN